MKEFFKTNKPIKISMIVLALFLVIIIPYALSENKGNNNKTINATEKETSKETKKETNNETKKEVVKKETNKETKKEKETSKKDDKNQKTQNNEKIERYVKVQSAEYKTIEKEVDDLDRPIYNEYGRERWFVYNGSSGETKYFYSAKEAADYFYDNKILGNWGTAEDEIVVTDEIVGYETKIVKEEIKVSDEVWEWKH